MTYPDTTPEVIAAVNSTLTARDLMYEADIVNALAARLAEVEAERNEYKKLAIAGELVARHLNIVEAECDTALAHVAGAFEVAAIHARAQFDDRGNSRSGHPSHNDWTDGYDQATQDVDRRIRALTPTLATAALTAMIDRARGETIEAAKALPLRFDERDTGEVQPLITQQSIDALHTPATRDVKGGE